MANDPNPTTTDHEGHDTPARDPDLSNPPTPPSSFSSHAASATDPDIIHTLDMTTTMARFKAEKSMTPSFDRIEKVSQNLVPRRAARDVPLWAVRYFLWIRDQKERVAIATQGTCHNDDEGHENPWKPCQPSDDAKEWNGIEGIDGAPPGVDLARSATTSATDKPTIADEDRTSALAKAFHSQNTSLVDS